MIVRDICKYRKPSVARSGERQHGSGPPRRRFGRQSVRLFRREVKGRGTKGRSMAIGYVDYDLPETTAPIRDLIAHERGLDRDVARRVFDETREGVPTSPLFSLEANASLVARHQDADRLERDIRRYWKIEHAGVERSPTMTAIYVSPLGRLLSDSGTVAAADIDHLIYRSYNLNAYEMDGACVPCELRDRYGIDRCSVTPPPGATKETGA